MARITLHIDADSADDLRLTLASILLMDGEDAGRFFKPEEDEQPEAGAVQDAEPGERQARFKRTKDEIARGLTVEQAKAERASAGTSDSPSPSSPSTQPSQSTSPGSSSGEGTTVDPFAESQPSPPTSGGSPTAALTATDVRDAMSAWLGRDNHQAEGMLPIFARFKTTEGDPCARASQLQAADYAAFIEALKA